MEFALPTVIGVAILALVLWAVRRRSSARAPAPPVETVAGVVDVVVDIGDVDAGDPVVQRLVRDAGTRALAVSTGAEQACVLSRTGKVLGRVTMRSSEQADLTFPTLSVMEPPPHRRIAGAFEHPEEPLPTAGFDPRERPAPKQPLAEALDLPEAVRARIHDPDDAPDIVRAILGAAGMTVAATGDLLRVGDRVVIVLSHLDYAPDELNRAYLRFRDSGAASGIVLSPRYMDARDVRRRELMAPRLRHAGTDGIQRMADAVALGEDPLAFALGAPVVRTDQPPRSAQAK